jgi:phospholipid/cholesterol/gamma-HCH transport system permease protein
MSRDDFAENGGGTPSAIAELQEQCRGITLVLQKAVHFTLFGKSPPGSILKAMYEMGFQSASFLCLVMAFIGMILVYQGGIQLLRVVPDMTLLGPNFIDLLIRDLAASICALMLATRVGAAMAAEIGSMAVTEQVDALRMCAADPVDYLIKPRFVASLIMTPILVVVAAVVAFLAGMFTGHAFFDIQYATFADLRQVSAGDVTIGLTKCFAYGAAVPVVSGYYGLTARGGSEGVGEATTRAVVGSSLAVIILNFIISLLGFVLFD